MSSFTDDRIESVKKLLPELNSISAEAVIRSNGKQFSVTGLPSLCPHLSLQRATIRQMLGLMLKAIQGGDEAMFKNEIAKIKALVIEAGADEEDFVDYLKQCPKYLDEKNSDYAHPDRMKKLIDEFLKTEALDVLNHITTVLYPKGEDKDMKKFMMRYTMNPLIKPVKRRPKLTFGQVSFTTGALFDSLHQGLEHIAHKMMARDNFSDKEHVMFNKLKSRTNSVLKRLIDLKLKFKGEILPRARDLGVRKDKSADDSTDDSTDAKSIKFRTFPGRGHKSFSKNSRYKKTPSRSAAPSFK